MQNFDLTERRIKEFTEYLGETSGRNFMTIVKEMIRLDPFSGHKFYIFSFIKLKEKQRFHQPRLTKPEPVPGGTLVRVDPKNPDQMEMCWTLPGQEAFGLYKYKKLFADQFVYECVQTYLNEPRKLMKPEPDDVSEEDAKKLYEDFRKKIARMDAAMKQKEAESKAAVDRITRACEVASETLV
jgi:hypothetical protein